MKFFSLILMTAISSLHASNLYEHKLTTIDGDETSLSEHKGKVILMVNVASRCGFTYQYDDLQRLHDQYDNLIVLGVPCNQFANQEPKNEKDIMQFCSNNFNISFPMTKKTYVKGKKQHLVYQWLTDKSKNNFKDLKVSWNFNKFLINPEGYLIGHFGSGTKPMSDKIISLIK